MQSNSWHNVNILRPRKLSKVRLYHRCFRRLILLSADLLKGPARQLHPNHMLLYEVHCSLAACAKLVSKAPVELESLRAALASYNQVLPDPSCEKANVSKRFGAALLQVATDKGPTANKKLLQKMLREASEVLEDSVACHIVWFAQVDLVMSLRIV